MTLCCHESGHDRYVSDRDDYRVNENLKVANENGLGFFIEGLNVFSHKN
jgi:hypothetical protein